MYTIMSRIIERIGTDPHEFKGATAQELGYDNDNLQRAYYEWQEKNSGIRLGLYRAQLEHVDPSTTIILQAPHNCRLDQLWMARMDMLASRTKTRVIGVEMPGTGGILQANDDGSWQEYQDTAPLEGAHQSLAQILGALRGDFKAHTALQFQAIEETVGLDDNARIILFGESMGAAQAVDSLEYLREHDKQVSNVVLYEMVNSFSKRRPLSLLHLMKVLPSIENDWREQYVDENRFIGHPVIALDQYPETLDHARTRSKQQKVWATVNGIGMMKGKGDELLSQLEQYGNNAPEISFYRGQDSLAVDQQDMLGLSAALRERGIKTTTTEVYDVREKQPIGHSHLVSLGRLAIIIDALRKQLSLS